MYTTTYLNLLQHLQMHDVIFVMQKSNAIVQTILILVSFDGEDVDQGD